MLFYATLTFAEDNNDYGSRIKNKEIMNMYLLSFLASQYRCHVTLAQIKSPNIQSIWSGYSTFTYILNILIYITSHPSSVYLRTHQHSWRMSNQEQNMNDLYLYLHLQSVWLHLIWLSEVFRKSPTMYAPPTYLLVFYTKQKLMHTIFPVTTSLAYFCFHICPGRKFTYSLYIIEKIQINISSVGSSLFFLLLSANTWLPVLLRHWWKTQMCSGACLWSRDHSILHLIHHLNCKQFSCNEQYRHIWSKEAVICLSDQISDPSSRYHESESYQRC